MQHLNKDTFPWACSVKFAEVTYITINKRNIYHDYIFVSTVFHIQLSMKPKTNLDICIVFFLLIEQNNLISYLEADQSFVSNLFTLITIYKILNNISVLSNQISFVIKYRRISDMMCGCWKLCCCSYWLWEFCIGPLFSNLFLVQQSSWQGRELVASL